MDLTHPVMNKFLTHPDPWAAAAVRRVLGTAAAPHVRFADTGDGDDAYQVWSNVLGPLRRGHRLVVRATSSTDDYQVWVEKRTWTGFRPVRCISSPLDLVGILAG